LIIQFSAWSDVEISDLPFGEVRRSYQHRDGVLCQAIKAPLSFRTCLSVGDFNGNSRVLQINEQTRRAILVHLNLFWRCLQRKWVYFISNDPTNAQKRHGKGCTLASPHRDGHVTIKS
jgi:hypothetical protein